MNPDKCEEEIGIFEFFNNDKNEFFNINKND